MYFYEVLSHCDENRLTEAFLALCTGSPDIGQTKEIFLVFLNTLKTIKPNLSDQMTILVEQKQAADGSAYDIAHVFKVKDAEPYGLELNPWADTLGYLTDQQSIAQYGLEVYIANILWEMTYFGFSEECIRQKVEEWENAFS